MLQVCVDTLNISVIPYLFDSDKIDYCWFMGDCVKHHQTQQTFDLLAEYFDNGIIWLNSKKNIGNGIDWQF